MWQFLEKSNFLFIDLSEFNELKIEEDSIWDNLDAQLAETVDAIKKFDF